MPEDQQENSGDEKDFDFSIVPHVSYSKDLVSRTRAKMIHLSSPLKKENQENLFIYKDFETSLTKVKGPAKRLP